MTAAGIPPAGREVNDLNKEMNKSRITETSIGGTVYIVEASVSESAKETVYSKVKRLILNNADEQEKASEQTQYSKENDSTSPGLYGNMRMP